MPEKSRSLPVPVPDSQSLVCLRTVANGARLRLAALSMRWTLRTFS